MKFYNPTMRKWHERLSDLHRQSGMTIAELARKSGVPYDNLRRYLDGLVDQPRGSVIDQLAEALGVSRFYLLLGVDIGADTPDTNQLRHSHFVPLISMADLGRSVGTNITQAIDTAKKIPIPFEASENLIFVVVEGDQNAGRFSDGDYVGLQLGNDPVAGDWAAFRLAAAQIIIGKYTIIQDSPSGRTVSVQFANPDYGSMMLGPGDEFEVIGTLKYHMSTL